MQQYAQGLQKANCTDEGGRENIGFTDAGDWNKVVELTKDRYKLMPYVIMGHHENRWPDFKGFHWKNYTKEVEADIEYIKNSK